MPDVSRFGRRTDGPTGRRRAVRERINVPVSLYSVDQSRVALLADLSTSGCRLEGTGLPEIGKDVLLKTADVELFGRIVWKDGRHRGVVFDEPMSDTNLEDLRQMIARQYGIGTEGPDIIPPEGRRQSPE